MNSLAVSLAPVTNFLRKHHPVLFICLICLLLAGAIFSLYQVLESSNVPSETKSNSIGTFDEETIKRIDSLHASSDTTTEELQFSDSRISPFNELRPQPKTQ